MIFTKSYFLEPCVFPFPVIFSLAFSINGLIIAFFPVDKEFQNISGILAPGFCEPCSGSIETLKVEKYRAGCFDLIVIFFCWSAVFRASDFFQDWGAEVTHGTKNGGSFSEMIGPSISN